MLLTPGPWSETAFEHAYLASYLGYPLVEGTDLTVRDGRVWMRSLRRLERVDVILRRTDAWFCDPLELRPDSKLGRPRPGRGGPSRGRFHRQHPRQWRAREPRACCRTFPAWPSTCSASSCCLPSVPTWWCGDEESRRHVLAHLDSLVIKPIARRAGPTSVFPWELSRERRDDLRRRIEARPGAWVGQETIELASAPTLTSTGLEARQSVLRAFAVARRDSYCGDARRLDPGGCVSNRIGSAEAADVCP